MHGRPRKAPNPEEEASSAAKAEKLRALQSQFLSNHRNNIYIKEAVELSAKLLEINPESYTAWNYRKLAFEHNLSQSESDPDSVKSIFNEELRVVESALRQNFKSYGAWHHRKWVLSKGHSSIDHELQLLDKFQKADSRNFHAWNYRRFVAGLMNRSNEDEIKYTEDMINNNSSGSFSNYSAWHNRSVLLSSLLREKVEGYLSKEDVLLKEYEFILNALFTDPDDQSGWFYHLWLLDQTVREESPVLVSTWPAHNSNLILMGGRSLDEHVLSSFTSFKSNLGTFPLILYFNQAVKGLNTSTITVKYGANTFKDLVWRPLSTNNSQVAQGWLTYIIFPVEKLHSLGVYPVEVSVGVSQGLVSSSGFHYSQPSRFSFKMSVRPAQTELSEPPGEEMIFFRHENFENFEPHSQESGLIISFGRLLMKNDDDPVASKWEAAIIDEQIKHFRVLSEEMNCKIGKLTLARLLRARDVLMFPLTNKLVHSEEVLDLYKNLMKLDPFHSQYYKDEYSVVMSMQVTSSFESLLKRCFQYRDLTSSNNDYPICLRLNSLSLSRLGSIENLLWLQMLDLSHNELRSIEGLEAMQLLSCLSLSNNKLASFTALEPLRLLKSLKVLDVSYNEIGTHSVDTTRYLCASPLSHSVGSEWNCDETITGIDGVTKFWEAFLIFKGLNLRQLDIKGNAIADEKFRSFMIMVLPTLKWLDGLKLH